MKYRERIEKLITALADGLYEEMFVDDSHGCVFWSI